MAWYLLGKDYERNGEQGKANYCFNRAEEVYEAFELSKVPADIWKNYEMRLLQVEKEREKRAKRIRRALLAAVILLLCLVPSVGAPGDPGERLAAEAFDELLPEAKSAGTDDEPDKNGNEEYDGPLFTAAAIGGGKEGNGLSGLLDKPSRLPSHSVVLGMERAGRWKIWSRGMPAMYGITRDPSGVIGIRPYQGAKELCGCEPADDAALTKTAAGWAEIQVHGAVLSEAVRRFHEDRGRLPKSLNELAQPFPNNWLSGRSPEMKALFPHFVSGRNARDSGKKQGKGGEAAGVPRLPGGLGSSPDGKPFFTDPLVVVVDRKKSQAGG
ncbi:hypothetical protein [Paenibacillus sp. DMB20]|uniref:hypothetical protein n=1 Tax=Paenibacillus sp. DMB20 TaxID=1642570 RepID=UPI000B10F6FB|nr:hypothetical protein [Paenibacillus sp. DMB20]